MTADALGGVFQYSAELASGLAKEGIEIILAMMGGPLSAEQRGEIERIGPQARLFESRFRLEWMDDPWDDVDRAGEWLLEIAESFAPDVVHLNGYSHAALSWPCPVVVVAHSCVLSWWRAVHGTAAPPRYGDYHRRVSAGLERADAVVAPSQAMLDAIRATYARAQEGVVIYNGRSGEDFGPAAKQPFVLGLGRIWDDAKNLAALDAAARGLVWPVVIGGARASEAESEPFRHGRYMGALGPSALRDVLSRAAIYALPARYEPFGLSVLEAALSGCALVLGKIASLTEIWGDAALFVDPGDVDDLRSALERLIADQDLRAFMSRRAMERARRYASHRTTSMYVALYERLVNRRDQRA